MGELSFLPAFALVWAMAVVLPGPNFLAAARSSLSGSRRLGALTALGVATGSVTWAFSAMVGLHALFMAFAWLYETVKIVGGLYLLYMGLTLVRSAMNGEERGDMAPRGGAGGYRLGLLTNLSNPKSAAFFGSMFLTLLPHPLSPLQACATLAVVFTVSLSWYSLVAYGFSLRCMRRAYRRIRRPLSACIGGLLAFFGARLILAED